jgi:glycosyltransferase involved in cell wall biosynthesis
MTVYGILPGPGAFPGVSRTFDDMRQFGLKIIYAHEYRQIKEEDLAIFGAYHQAYAIPIRRLKCKKFLLWTSPLLQMELSPDEPGIFNFVLDLKDRGIIDQIWFGDPGMWKVYEDKGFHMPYPLDANRLLPFYKKNTDRHGISLFCPWTPRKNILTQLAAVKIIQKDFPDSVLYGNNMNVYAPIAQRMGVSFVDCGWMKDDVYYQMIQKVKVGLQVFLSESFCFTAFDHIVLGTPVVASACLDWLPDQLKVKNSDDPVEIADKIIKVGNEYSCIDAYRESVLEMARARNARVSEAFKCHTGEGADSLT